MATSNDSGGRRGFLRLRRTDRRPAPLRTPADWQKIGELARSMQRRELLDAIASNRRRRERATDELESANLELDDLLAFARKTSVARGSECAEVAGMTRQAVAKRLGRTELETELETAA